MSGLVLLVAVTVLLAPAYLFFLRRETWARFAPRPIEEELLFNWTAPGFDDAAWDDVPATPPPAGWPWSESDGSEGRAS